MNVDGQKHNPAMQDDGGDPVAWDEAESSHVLALLAENIRHLRDQRGMTRKLLAAQSGVSLPHLARLESSQGNVSVLILDKVAKALNQPISRLFAEAGTSTGDFEAIVELLKRRSPEQLAQIRHSLASGFPSTHQDGAGHLALIGLRGSGKSTVGRRLAERLGRTFVELNAEIEREAGISIQEIFSFYGQSGFRRLEHRCLERLLATHRCMVLATGGGIVVEPSTYDVLRASCFTIWLYADYQVYFQRAMEQHDARIAQPRLYQEAMENIQRTMESRDLLYRMADFSVDTTQLDVPGVVDAILAGLPSRALAARD